MNALKSMLVTFASTFMDTWDAIENGMFDVFGGASCERLYSD